MLDVIKFAKNGCILPPFYREVYERMVLFTNTKLYQIYYRIFSYNWTLPLNINPMKQYSKLPLIDIYYNLDYMKPRELNSYELKFFKYLNDTKNNYVNNSLYSVYIFKEFITNLCNKVYYKNWNKIIFDYIKDGYFCMSGGSLLRCLVRSYQNITDTQFGTQDIDFFACNMSYFEYIKNMYRITRNILWYGNKVINISKEPRRSSSMNVFNLYVNFDTNAESMAVNSTLLTHKVYFFGDYRYFKYDSKQSRWVIIDFLRSDEITLYGLLLRNGILHRLHPIMQMLKRNHDLRKFRMIAYSYVTRFVKMKREIEMVYNKKILDIEKTKWVNLQFVYFNENSNESKILHAFDLDCCQVVFDGKRVSATPAFVQSINTNTMINYNAVDNFWLKNEKRVNKYIKRGGNLLISKHYNPCKRINKEIKMKERIIALEWERKRHMVLRRSFDGLNYNGYLNSKNNDWFGIRKEFIKSFW